MPYKIQKVAGGFKTTSPSHPHGFSKHPQSKAQATAQMRAILANTKEELPKHEKMARERAKNVDKHKGK